MGNRHRSISHTRNCPKCSFRITTMDHQAIWQRRGWEDSYFIWWFSHTWNCRWIDALSGTSHPHTNIWLAHTNIWLDHTNIWLAHTNKMMRSLLDKLLSTLCVLPTYMCIFSPPHPPCTPPNLFLHWPNILFFSSSSLFVASTLLVVLWPLSIAGYWWLLGRWGQSYS